MTAAISSLAILLIDHRHCGRVRAQGIPETIKNLPMKLNIDPKSLFQGAVSRRFGEKKKAEINDIIARKHPVVVSPFHTLEDGERCAAAFIKTSQVSERMVTLSVVPIVGRFFVVCEARSSTPKAVVLRLNGKYEQKVFENSDHTNSAYSFFGPGVDPELVEDSKTALANIIQNHSGEPCVKRALEYLRESLLK